MSHDILQNVKGVIFDLDGTLLDSMGIWNQIDLEFLGKRGIPLPPDYQKIIAPLGASAAAEYTIRRFDLKDKPEDLMREWHDMAMHHYAETIPLKPFAGEYVRLLAKRGLRLCVATSSERSMVEAALKRTGLLQYMEFIVTVAEVARGKGFPDIYLACADRFGLSPEECIVFEDIIEGIRGAHSGGFRAVGVYEAGGFDHELIRDEADYYIRSFQDLL